MVRAIPNPSRLPAIGEDPPTASASRNLSGSWVWALIYAYASTASRAIPNGKDSASFCGGAAAGVADPTNYPAFMRYAMRASLKANYTAYNLGFRCAGGAP